MDTIGRNDLCPCGSGKKYKRCCLGKERDKKTLELRQRRGMELALDWLEDHHGEAIHQAVDHGFFKALSEAEQGRLGGLSPELFELVQVDAAEWLLADAAIEVDGAPQRSGALVLGPDGPALEDDQRSFIESLMAAPLALLEVTRSVPYEGLFVRRALDGAVEPEWVEAPELAGGLGQGDFFGARILPGEPARLSIAHYPLPAAVAAELLVAGSGEERALATERLIGAWLRSLLSAVEEPPR